MLRLAWAPASSSCLGPITTSDAGGGDANGIGIISSGASLDFANNRAYFASRARAVGSSDTVWCLSFTDTGANLLWSRDAGDVDGSPILRGGKIYVGNNSGEVHALDAVTGTDLWSAPFATGNGLVKGYVWPSFSNDDLFFSTIDTVWSISGDGPQR